MRYEIDSASAAGGAFFRFAPLDSGFLTVVTDAAGRIVRASDAFAERLGVVSDDLRGRRLAELRIEGGAEGPCRYAVAGRGVSGVAATAAGANGSILTIVVEDPERAHLLSSVERAEASSRDKTRLLAVLGHEIRTPLNAILTAADLLAREEAPATGRHCDRVETIRASGRTLLDLLVTLIEYATGDSGAIGLNPQRVDPRGVVERAAMLFRGMADAKGVRLIAEIGHDVPREITVDPVRLIQVLCNLIANAVRFTDEGAVCLRVGMAGDALRFEVSDTGRGMQPERVRALFAPAPGMPAEGSGLGLSICKAIADAMNARLSAESAPGRGSTFRFDLPI